MTGCGNLRSAAALVAGAMALAALAAAPAAAGAAPLARPAATALRAAAADVCVSVVVDRASVSASCVKVPPGSTGAQVLIARARQLGRTPPRFDNSGLVCAIDGYPETGCAEASGGGFSYWSYWHKHGGGSWQYSSAGAFLYTVGGTQPSEGWAWIEGGQGNRPPASPSYTSVCPPSITDPSPTPSVRPTRKPTPKPSPKPTVHTSSPVRRPTTNPVTRHSPTAARPAPTATSTTGEQTATAARPTQPSSVAAVAPAGSGSPPAKSGGPAAAPVPPSSASPADESTGPQTTAGSAIAAEPAANQSPGGPPAGLYIGLALVLGVGAAAGYQVWRRRTRP